MKKFLFFLVLFISVPLNSFAKQFDFKKIINLEAPWGSSFINAEEIITDSIKEHNEENASED